jgi:excisionase family DNA binding protein
MDSYCTWCHQSDLPFVMPETPPPPDPLRGPKCPRCHRGIFLIGITNAAKVMNVSRKTIYHWIEKGLITTCRTASGRQLVCYSSLFDGVAAGDGDR